MAPVRSLPKVWVACRQAPARAVRAAGVDERSPRGTSLAGRSCQSREFRTRREADLFEAMELRDLTNEELEEKMARPVRELFNIRFHSAHRRAREHALLRSAEARDRPHPDRETS